MIRIVELKNKIFIDFQNSSQILYYALKDSVMQDSEQESVLLLKKWLLIRIYLSNESVLSDLWPFFDQVILIFLYIIILKLLRFSVEILNFF